MPNPVHSRTAIRIRMRLLPAKLYQWKICFHIHTPTCLDFRHHTYPFKIIHSLVIHWRGGHHKWGCFVSTAVFVPYDGSALVIHIDVKHGIDVQVQAIWEDPCSQEQVAGDANIPFPTIVAGNPGNEIFGINISKN